jgi:hypothetical protein
LAKLVAPRLTVVDASTKQHMVVRREDDQKEEAPDQGGEEELPHCIVETPPITSETLIASAILLRIKHHVFLLLLKPSS